MIVETDFVDHWKTQKLVRLCGADGVLCLLRLWAFCQLRKQWRFEKCGASKLEAIAKWDGKEMVFYDALKEVGFIEVRLGNTITMHDFDQVNASMVKNWKNGRKGGRPPAGNREEESEEEPSENPKETDDKPSENPKGGEGEPKEEINNERINNKKNPPKSPKGETASSSFRDTINALALDTSAEDREKLCRTFDEFCMYRRDEKRKPLQPKSGERQAKLVCKCLKTFELSADDICGMMNEAMNATWQGWYWERNVVRVKEAKAKNAKNKKPPLDDNMRIGSIGIPAGASDF